jgi:hypothetical protein
MIDMTIEEVSRVAREIGFTSEEVYEIYLARKESNPEEYLEFVGFNKRDIRVMKERKLLDTSLDNEEIQSNMKVYVEDFYNDCNYTVEIMKATIDKNGKVIVKGYVADLVARHDDDVPFEEGVIKDLVLDTRKDNSVYIIEEEF